MTHCERLLEYLSDGQPHTHHELYGLRMIVHSRVSDLRRQGYRIDQWRDGDAYLYRLVVLDTDEEEDARSSGASSVSSAPVDPTPQGALAPNQMTLI